MNEIYIDSDWETFHTEDVLKSALNNELFPIVSEDDGGIIGYILAADISDAYTRFEKMVDDFMKGKDSD